MGFLPLLVCFQVKQEDQQTKKQVDKGKVLVRKLGQKVKSEDKKEVKLEETRALEG